MSSIVVTLKEMNDTGRKMLENAGCQIITAREDMTYEGQIELIKEVQPDAIFCRVDRVGKEMIDASPNLKVIAKQGVGLDNIDIDYASQQKIYICNSPGGNSVSVAEHSILLMMMCATRHQYVENQMHAGNFNVRYKLRNTFELKGLTLGIIGTGAIGQMVAKIASVGFGMKIIGFDLRVTETLVPLEYMSMEDVFRKADFVSLHLPSNPVTRHSIGYELFSLMKPTAYLINCARGDIIVEEDLVRAIKEGKMAGAGLDVFDQEPPTLENPLLHMEEVVATPHTGATTSQSSRRCTEIACQGILDVLNRRKRIAGQANWF